MADIKITQLKAEKQTEKMVDLKTEAEKANSSEFTAFTTVRGGVAFATAKWSAAF